MKLIDRIRGSVINIWLTTLCNQNCEYCFGRGTVTGSEPEAKILSIDELYKFVDWLFRSPFANRVQLMGGEPTQHPDIVEIVRKLNERNIQTESLLTNGLAETEIFSRLKDYIPHFLFSINPPDSYSTEEWELIQSNLDLLSYSSTESKATAVRMKKANRVTLSATFYSPKQSLDYVIDLAREFNIPRVRISAAHPAPDFQNKYLGLEDLQSMGATFLEFVKSCAGEGIGVISECFFPPCIFTLGEWIYFKNLVKGVNSCCEIPFELLPGLKIGFGACNFGKFDYYHLESARDFGAVLRDWFDRKQKLVEYRPEFCGACEFFDRKICQGGCLREKARLMEKG